MAIAWFLCPYKPFPNEERARYCAMDDFTPLIFGEGGGWDETEILGNAAIVKVRASAGTLATLAGTFFRFPNLAVTDSLSALTAPQATAISDQLIALGYPLDEVTVALGSDLRTKTFGDVLRFAASRRIKPRWDEGSKAIVFDGKPEPCKSIAAVDGKVR